MADINYNNIPNIETDWQGYSGQSVQKFIKEQLQSKVGVFYYDATSNRYLVFASEETKNEYIIDATKTELVLGTFDAPFNYSAEINLTSEPYNAVFLGSTGNAIGFTFDIKNKQGNSTFENVTITYTFLRNSIKKTFTEKRKFGDVVTLNIDKYIDEGTNTIMISIVGETTLAATSASVTYQVVNLSLSDSIDISTVYDLSNGNITAEFPYSVSGYGTKVMEWYLDGVLQPFVKAEDEIVDISASRIKYITLSNLQQGRHSLQLRAYTTVNGERFYTDVLYRDLLVYTGANKDMIISIATTLPRSIGTLGTTDAIALYDIVQYIPYTLRFATYSPTNMADVNVSVAIDGVVKGVIATNNSVENRFAFTETTTGVKTMLLSTENVSYSLPISVAPTSMNLQEITAGLFMDFSALGKSNNSQDRETWTDGTYTGTLTGFNYNNTSGWVDGRLEMNEGATFAIDLSPLAVSPVSIGKTIEIEWSSKDVTNDDAVICDMRNDDGAGILITATKVSMTSINGEVIETEYKSNENVRVGFVINRSSGVTEQRLSYIYANGVLSRAVSYGATDDYTSDKPLVFTATKGALISLKSVRIYNAALTADNMLNNYILYRDTIAEMLEVYERNDIYESGTSAFSTERLSSRLPIMIVTGDIPTLENTSNKDTQIVVDIEYTNLQEPSKSFKMVNAAMRPQGTSSMGYPKKNFRIYTQKLDNTIVYDANGNVVESKLYSFKDNAQPVDCWCLKADYAESSGTHNTGIARLWNDALVNAQIDGEYKLRTQAQQAAKQSGYKYDVRTTIDGFPILLFYRPTINDELIFIGKYNFNNDKSTESVFGFTGIPGFDNSKMQCWEVLNNGNPLALFTTVDGFDSDWSEAFESRYPDTKTPDTSDLKAFCQWMTNVSQEDFATQKWEHFNVYMMAAYWVYLMRHAGADQFVKNAMFTSEDGQKWYYILYDNDTINGLINTGAIAIKPTDTRQTMDASGAYVFAGHDSRLWNMFEADEEFMQIVEQVDNALYSAGVSYINTIKMFDEEQAGKWVEKIYNQDARYKYIGPYVEKGVNNLFMLQGKRDLHRRWWLANRFAIYDAKYVSGTYKSNSVELKCINGTPAGQQFTIKAGYDLDYGYGINNVPRAKGVSLEAGQSHTFTTSEVVNLGDPIRIYGAPNIAEIDLSSMASRLAVVTIASVYDEALGTRLTKFVMGKEGVTNREVAEISGLKQAQKLEYIDVQGMANMTSLDLSNHPRMKTIKAFGSNIASMSFTKGAPIERLELPSVMRMLTLEQLPYLQASNIAFENLANLTGLDIKSCPNISNDFSFVYDWYTRKIASNEVSMLTMDNVNWEGVNPDQLIEIANIRLLNLKGKVTLESITLEQLTRLQEVFGNTAFDQDADFFIDAPASVFIIGRTELLEGTTEQYSCIAFGSKIKSITWKIVSGGKTNYTSIDETSGLLTVLEGYGSGTLGISAIVITESDISTQTFSVAVSARVYPTSSQTYISGVTRLDEEFTVYTLAYTAEFNGTIEATWSLSGMEEYAEIVESDNTSCTVKKLKEAMSLVQGTLSCQLKKKHNSASLFTVTKSIEVVNESIAETDAGICQALYNAGLCANISYITKEEAALVTADDLQPGTSDSSSIFYAQRNNIKSFDGFKYFISVTEIKRYTFYGGTLKSITLPESVTTIGVYAFNYSAINSLVIPNSVTSFSTYSFSNCASLQSIILSENLTTIPSGCFYKCTKLKSIIIPDSVTKIEYQAFESCSSLEYVYIGKNLTTMSNQYYYPFLGMHSMEFEVHPDNPSFSSIDGVLFNKDGTSILCFRKDAIFTDYIVPENVVSMGSGCFYYCSMLKTIKLSPMLGSISYYGFRSCSGLTALEIPESVTYIGSYSLEYCSALESINIPEGITSIDSEVFYSCSSLTSIKLPQSLRSIGYSALGGCKKLTSIEIPANVTSIAGSAFSGTPLERILLYPETAPSVQSNSFDKPATSAVMIISPIATGYDAGNWPTVIAKGYEIQYSYEPTECTSLSITADDVPSRATKTKVYWTAITNGINILTGDVVSSIKLTGVVESEPFPQNTSTTDTVLIEVSYTYMGITANTTITQGVWLPSSYTVDLNDEWRESTTISNPDTSLYDGVYESFSNYNLNSSFAVMYIDIFGYTNFTLYIRSYGETYADYIMVSQLDVAITGNETSSDTTKVKAHTRGNPKSGTAISDYTLVEYTGIDADEHRITIIYRKDSGVNSGDDRGYVLIPKDQGE